MAALAPLPPLPAQFKSIQHHLRTAQEHDKRDAVVAYYCRLYAMQTGMKIDSKTPECRKFLSKLMDQLEALKKQLGDNEAITQEIVGCAHLENYALKMFLYADNEDRAGRFHKNMIKSFYTASLLIDVITVFGELTDENVKHRKYARWKATYIHNCLKNGRLLKQALLELKKIMMLKKMKMLEQPLCPLSQLSHHHLQLMTQATCHQATILEYRFLRVHTLQLIHQQKCLTAQV